MQGLGGQYGSAELLLFEPTAAHRATTRAALNMVGFQRITAASNLDELMHCVSQRPFDVLIADLSGAVERVCSLMRDIRHGERGKNPFLVALLTAWALRKDEVAKVLSSGADDLLIRPYSVTVLAERVRMLVEARKGFVVTNGYIGPDRRKTGDRADEANFIDVPNTLRLKSKPAEGARGGDPMELVREAQAKIGDLKLKMTAMQLRLLAYFALKSGPSEAVNRYTAPLSAVARVFAERFQDYAEDEAAAIVGSLLEALASLMRGENVAESLGKLNDCAVTLHALLNADRGASEREEEFARALERLVASEAAGAAPQSAAE